MKKKILIMTGVLSLALAGVVSAASIWGTYKGNEIIRLTVGGDPVKVTDVPAVNYNNRTMIPIYLLKQAGINYTWDQANRTVDIQGNNGFVSKQEYIQMNKAMQEHRAFIIFMDQLELTFAAIDALDSSTNNQQYQQSMDLVNRISLDTLDGLVNSLKSYNDPVYSTFSSISSYISDAKKNALNGQTQLAFNTALSARSLMNSLYTTIDSNYLNAYSDKNMEIE